MEDQELENLENLQKLSIDLNNVDDKLKCAYSYKNFKSFFEYVARDFEEGNNVRFEGIHSEWDKFILQCKEEKRFAGILAPFEHGKSFFLCYKALHEIGRNPNIRVKIISSKDDIAIQRVGLVQGIIENNPTYKKIFGIEPDFNKGWSKYQGYVKRTVHSLDPTIEAKSILSTGIGGRADLMILDDPQDPSALFSEAYRKQCWERLTNLWLTRISKNGMVVLIMTRWHEKDLAGMLMSEVPRFKWLVQRISPDMEYIEQEIY